MVYDKANELAKQMSESNEYQEYKRLREKVMQSDTNKALIKELHELQIRAQASIVSGKKDDEAIVKLQKIGELLQFNADTSAFLTAEYRLNKMLGDVYKILADAVQIDLGFLEQ